MYKSKLGISVGLFGALVCLLALLLGTSWPLLAIMAYILVREDNEWLRRLTLKVLIFIIAIAVINLAFSQLDIFVYKFFSVFNHTYSNPIWLDSLTSFITTTVTIIGDVVLLFMGLKALKQGHFAIKSIDEVISKNI